MPEAPRLTCSQVKMLPSFQQNGFTNLSHPRHDSPIRMGLWPAYPGLEGITIRFTKIRGKYGAWAAPNDMIKSGTFRRHPTPGAARKRIRHFGLVLVHHNKAGWADERARCHSKLMRCEMLLLQDFQSFRAIGNILTRFSILSSRCFPCFKNLQDSRNWCCKLAPSRHQRLEVGFKDKLTRRPSCFQVQGRSQISFQPRSNMPWRRVAVQPESFFGHGPRASKVFLQYL